MEQSFESYKIKSSNFCSICFSIPLPSFLRAVLFIDFCPLDSHERTFNYTLEIKSKKNTSAIESIPYFRMTIFDFFSLSVLAVLGHINTINSDTIQTHIYITYEWILDWMVFSLCHTISNQFSIWAPRFSIIELSAMCVLLFRSRCTILWFLFHSFTREKKKCCHIDGNNASACKISTNTYMLDSFLLFHSGDDDRLKKIRYIRVFISFVIRWKHRTTNSNQNYWIASAAWQ